jgi:hypothetical protein
LDVFRLRHKLVDDYGSYVSSFIRIKDERIKEKVRNSLGEGLLWPDPLIQLNPSFEAGETIDELVAEGILHEECARIFRRKRELHDPGEDLRLHRHQADAIRTARAGHNYVLTTGTGSGKSRAYIVPRHMPAFTISNNGAQFLRATVYVSTPTVDSVRHSPCVQDTSSLKLLYR